MQTDRGSTSMGHYYQNLRLPRRQNASRMAWLLLACLLSMGLGMAQATTVSSDAKPTLEVVVQVRPPGRSRRNADGKYEFISEVSALGVRVEVCEYPIGPEVRILAKYKTDKLGNVTIQVPADGYSRQPRGKAAVALRVQHDGYQNRFVTNLYRRESGTKGPYTTGFNLIPGRTVLGRVYGPDGKACSAKVEFRTEGSSVVVKPRFHVGGCTASSPPNQGIQQLGQGTFAFHYEQDLQVDFLATAKGVGCGALLGMNLALDSNHEDLRITLGGPGVLRGRLADGSGNPMNSVTIDCAPAAGEEAHARIGWTCQNWNVKTPGILNARTRTDAQGRFEIKGLRVGAYRLSIPGGYRAQSDSFDLLHEANSHEIELIATKGEIRIKLLDVDGQPLEGYNNYFDVLAFQGGVPAYQSPVLVVSKSVSTPWGLVPGERIFPWFDSKSGDNIAVVTPGLSYFVRVWGPTFDETQFLVQVPETGTSKPIVLKAKEQPDRETGHIKVAVAKNVGNESSHSLGFTVGLESLQTRIPLLSEVNFEWEDFENQSGQIELPVGLYRLVVSGAHGLVGSNTNHRPIRLGRKESFIQVEEGVTRSYHVSPEKAGKLRVHIKGTPTDSAF